MKRITIDISGGKTGVGTVIQAAKIFASKTKYVSISLIGDQKDLTSVDGEERITPVYASEAGNDKPSDPHYVFRKAIEEAKKTDSHIIITFEDRKTIRALAEEEFIRISTPCFITYFLTKFPNRYCLLGDCGYQPSMSKDEYLSIRQAMETLAKKALYISSPTTAILSSEADTETLPENVRDAYDAMEGTENFKGLVPFQEIMNNKADIYLTEGYTSKAIIDSYQQCYLMYVEKINSWVKSDFKAKLSLFFGNQMYKDIQRLTTAKLDATGLLLLGYDRLVLSVPKDCSVKEFQDILSSADRYLDYYREEKQS